MLFLLLFAFYFLLGPGRSFYYYYAQRYISPCIFHTSEIKGDLIIHRYFLSSVDMLFFKNTRRLICRTETDSHGNAGCLIHWARIVVERTSSWILVGFVNHWATMETPRLPHLEKLKVTKGDRLVGRDGLGVWDGNVLKLGYDGGSITVNIIQFIELKKNKTQN